MALYNYWRKGIWNSMKKGVKWNRRWTRKKKPEGGDAAGFIGVGLETAQSEATKRHFKNKDEYKLCCNTLFCLSCPDSPNLKFTELQPSKFWVYVQLIDWLEIAYKDKFDIWGNSLLSRESKHMRERSLEQKWPWEWGCPGIWRKVWKEGRCAGLAPGMEQGLKLILLTSQEARTSCPTSGLYICNQNTDGFPWVQIISTLHLLLISC